MSTVELELKPWDGIPRFIRIEVNGKTVVADSLASGKWELNGKVIVRWVDDVYEFDTADCVSGPINLGYEFVDPARPPSLTAACADASSSPPTPPTPMTPVTSADGPPPAPTAPPGAPAEPPVTTWATTPLPEPVAISVQVNKVDELPFTGNNTDVLAVIGICLIGLGLWFQRFKKKLDVL